MYVYSDLPEARLNRWSFSSIQMYGTASTCRQSRSSLSELYFLISLVFVEILGYHLSVLMTIRGDPITYRLFSILRVHSTSLHTRRTAPYIFRKYISLFSRIRYLWTNWLNHTNTGQRLPCPTGSPFYRSLVRATRFPPETVYLLYSQLLSHMVRASLKLYNILDHHSKQYDDLAAIHFYRPIRLQFRHSMREQPDIHARLMSHYPQGKWLD